MARGMSRSVTTRSMHKLAGLVLVGGALALVGSGCDVITSVGPGSCDQSDETNPITTYSDGTVENGIYMSSPWDEHLVYFPGGVRIRLEHKLGAVPREWQSYLAFDETGVKAGPLASAAGNQVELVSIDDQAITVRNGGCADYWLLITAEVSDGPAAPPTGS